MTIAFHIPCPPLARYIECFWYVNLRAPYRREKILPSGTVELIFNFGSHFRLYDRDDPQHFTLQTESWLVGLHTAYLLNEPIGETHMIGVRFKPGGAYPFFRLPASVLHNQVVPTDTLWGRFAAEVGERLYHEPKLAARFALLERLLLARLEAAPGLDLVLFAIDQLARHGSALSIKTLSDQVGLSQKHLITQFRRMVGVSPKALARLYRFQHVLHTIDPAQPVDWAEIAHHTLYYDQAHFNHDFAAFTGLSPTDYLRLRQQFLGDQLVRGEEVHFVPIG